VPSPDSVLDHAVGRFMTHNLADYHFSVHADVHDTDVIFVDEHDEVVNPLAAPRAWARSASSGSPPPSPTRSTTRPGGNLVRAH
jgi:hypothetical protein